MTFLKRLGTILAKGVAIAAGVGPMVRPFLGSGKAGQIEEAAINDLNSIEGIVIQAEVMIQTPGSGTAKLAAATPLVAAVLRTSQGLDGKKIENEGLFLEGATEITSGMAKCLNSIHPDEAKAA